MNISNVVFVSVVSVLFTGCASMFTPNSDLINKVPVIKMLSTAELPKNNEYILHIPAGEKIPVNFTVKGGLISKPIDSTEFTKLNKDVYVYKYWASFDGKDWQPTNELLNLPITFGVTPRGGQLGIDVDLVTKLNK